jgi:hypothetical protein
MLHQSLQARTALFVWSDDWLARYSQHLGLTLIALFEGFVIATGMDLRASSWVTGGVGVLGLAVGERVLNSAKGSGGEPRPDRILRRILDVFHPRPARAFYPIQGGAINGGLNEGDARITRQASGRSRLLDVNSSQLQARPNRE